MMGLSSPLVSPPITHPYRDFDGEWTPPSPTRIFVVVDCRGGVTSLLFHDGIIVSPGFPSHYPPVQRCRWRVDTPSPTRIFVVVDCRGGVTSLLFHDGIIVSPGFPSHYPPVQRCRWRVDAPDGHTIHLEFTEFQTEKTSLCKSDFVKVRT